MMTQFSGSHVRQNVGRLSRIPTFWRTWLLLCVLASSVSAAERPPNFLVILMDDMGWQDVGFMGNRFVETPHLDRLAKGGLTFTQAYASAPELCPDASLSHVGPVHAAAWHLHGRRSSAASRFALA